MDKDTLTAWAASLLLALGASAVQAQALYRSVGPDGRVTFSDTPPAAGAGKAAPGSSAVRPASGGSALPYDLQQVTNRYPVTLYTGDACGPCVSGRTFLSSRGIPFSERTVKTAEDLEALQRMSEDAGLPFLTVGSQQIKGFSDVEWGQFLDAAGYPKTSQLPPGYRAPAPSALVAVQRPAANGRPAGNTPAGGPGSETVNAPPRPAPETTDANPSGIRF